MIGPDLTIDLFFNRIKVDLTHLFLILTAQHLYKRLVHTIEKTLTC